MSPNALGTLHKDLEDAMRCLLDYLSDPPDPGPFRRSPLDGEMVGHVGDRGNPLSLAAGTLLLGLHYPMAARSTQCGGSAGFLANQAIFAT